MCMQNSYQNIPNGLRVVGIFRELSGDKTSTNKKWFYNPLGYILSISV